MKYEISKRITSAMSCNRLKLSELSTGGVHKKGCGGIEQPESDCESPWVLLRMMYEISLT
jgi:hypothetical protein